MEDSDSFIRPGNQERGWNDPPQFSYGLQTAQGPRRNLLTKRVPPPAFGPGAPSPSPAPPYSSPLAPPSSSPLVPPPCGIAPPPQGLPPPCMATPPPPCMATPPPPCLATPPPPRGPVTRQRDLGSSQSESEPDVEGVVSIMNRALSACRQVVPVQVCDDVAKRLHLLDVSWRSGRLSLPVRRRMNILALELQTGHWDSADEIHRSLMVDHVTEVSQWMVGIKRLIAETRNLSPELLDPAQNPEEPVQNPLEPVLNPLQPSQNPVEVVQDPADPVQESVQSTISQS